MRHCSLFLRSFVSVVALMRLDYVLLAIAGALAATGSGSDFERFVYPMPERCDSVVLLDINRDGKRDLVGICRTEIVGVILPEGRNVSLWKADDGAMIHGALWDADQDGDKDIVVGRFNAGDDFTIGWLSNPEWKMHPVTRELDGTHGVAVGDLNGDGQDDLVTANVKTPPASVAWFESQTKTLRFLDRAEAGDRPHYLAIGDLNGDGRNDVLLGDGGGFCFYRNPGGNSIGDEWERIEIARERGGTNVALADIDGDGDLDAVGACGHGTGAAWYENPHWKAHPIDTATSDIHAIDVGDLDGDGDQDVAFASFGGFTKPNDPKKRVYWAENNGSGQFTKHEIDVDSAQESYALVVTDVDGDGRSDIVLAGRGSKNIVWYRSR